MSSILYVDDEADLLLDHMSEAQRCHFTAFQNHAEDGFPEAFEAAREADTWLFDFFFSESAAMHPDDLVENGLSLFHKWRRSVGTARPVTAVISGHLESALGHVEPLGRSHINAKLLGVEWVGSKDDGSVIDKLIVLSNASAAIAASFERLPSTEMPHRRQDFGSALATHTLCSEILLVPPDADWAPTARRHVDHARPPRIVPPPPGFGTSRLIIAWLLHHVLPYPSFLLSDAHAAARLKLTPGDFRTLAAVDASDRNANALNPILYRGPLSSFETRRWWRAGIDNLSWSLQQSANGYPSAVRELASGRDLELLNMPEPVVLSDPDLVETEQIVDSDTCVRAADEHFPPDVAPAWVTKDSVFNDRELRAKVILEDLYLLDTA